MILILSVTPPPENEQKCTIISYYFISCKHIYICHQYQHDNGLTGIIKI